MKMKTFTKPNITFLGKQWPKSQISIRQIKKFSWYRPGDFA